MALIDPIDYSSSGDTRLQADIKINQAIDAINNIGGGTVDQIAKKVGSTDFDYVMTNSILPDSGVPNLKIKVFNIGDWNMDTTSGIDIPHGISNYKKVRSVDVIIRDDADANYYKLQMFDQITFAVQGGVYQISGLNVSLVRLTGGIFDDATFDSTSYNRGWITLTYEG